MWGLIKTQLQGAARVVRTQARAANIFDKLGVTNWLRAEGIKTGADFRVGEVSQFTGAPAQLQFNTTPNMPAPDPTGCEKLIAQNEQDIVARQRLLGRRTAITLAPIFQNSANPSDTLQEACIDQQNAFQQLVNAQHHDLQQPDNLPSAELQGAVVDSDRQQTPEEKAASVEHKNLYVSSGR